MRAVLLIVELKRDIEYCEGDVRLLLSKLPANCKKVMHGKRSIGFLMPAYDILPAIRSKLYQPLSRFENYWFIGLSGEALGMNGSLDPLISGIKEYSVAPLRRRETSKS